jgi:lysine/ornithine N-monooxygenase
VFFVNGESGEFDHIVLCTGYKIDLPYLSDSVRQAVLDEDTNEIKVGYFTVLFKLIVILSDLFLYKQRFLTQ